MYYLIERESDHTKVIAKGCLTKLIPALDNKGSRYLYIVNSTTYLRILAENKALLTLH